MMPSEQSIQTVNSLALNGIPQLPCGRIPPHSHITPFRVELGDHRLQYFPGNSTLVVSFENADRPGKDPYEDRSVWGEKFYRSAGYSLLGVQARKSDWYRNTNLINALEFLRDREFFSRFKHVVMVGGSMGAFAASAFAPLAPGCTVIALSPQVGLSPTDAPWELRFREGARENWNLPYGNAARGAQSASVCYVVYDNLLKADARHASAFGFDPNIVRLVIPGAGHSVADSLQKMGMLRSVSVAMIEHKFGYLEFYREIRKRRNIPQTYQMLASHAISRRKFEMAQKIENLAKKKFPNFNLLQGKSAKSLPLKDHAKSGNKMKKPLYLHIGTHRTATTNIQATMHRNWHNLLDLGYLYPLGVERHIGVINSIFKGEKNAGEVALDILRRSDSHKKPVHSIIMSDEDISMRRDLSPLKALGEVFDVKVVIAMRRQDLWLESWWAQNVKGQWDRDMCHIRWSDFLAQRQKFHWIDYKRYIDHIETVFGDDSVIPFVFERSQMADGPVAAFAKAVGISSIEHFNPAGGKNISLTPEMSEFVRFLPFIEAKMGYRLALIEVAEEVDRVIRAEGRSTLILPHELRKEIIDGYAEGNRVLAQRYFNRDELFLEELPCKNQEIVSPSLPQNTEVLMQRLVGPFVQALINRFDQN